MDLVSRRKSSGSRAGLHPLLPPCFELPANEAVGAATIEITADDQFDLFVNGQAAGQGDYWGSPKNLAIGGLLKPGKNVLAVEARNVGNNPIQPAC